MSELTYVRASTVSEAVGLLNEPGIRSFPLAGGTDMMIQLRRGEIPAGRFVDITKIPELKSRQVAGGPEGTVLLGAGVTISEILEDTALVAKVPLLGQAGETFGGPQIRNLATVGGNVINQAACADLLPVLICLEAVAFVAAPEGEYCVPVSELVSQPLPAGRIVRAFSFAVPPTAARSVYLRLSRRRTLTTARLSLTMLGRVGADGAIAEARIVPGAIFRTVRRVKPVEEMLVGQLPSESLFEACGQKMVDLFLAESGGRWSAPYKQVVISKLTERGLRAVYGN